MRKPNLEPRGSGLLEAPTLESSKPDPVFTEPMSVFLRKHRVN
jgi:hypothetical protein